MHRLDRPTVYKISFPDQENDVLLFVFVLQVGPQ